MFGTLCVGVGDCDTLTEVVGVFVDSIEVGDIVGSVVLATVSVGVAMIVLAVVNAGVSVFVDSAAVGILVIVWVRVGVGDALIVGATEDIVSVVVK